MEPASASVAFVGFAASLTTLAALVLDASTTLYNAQRRFKHAPDDIKRLSTQLEEFERLLHEVHKQIQNHQNEYASSAIGALLARATDQMHTDMSRFKLVVQRLNALLCAPTAHGRLLVLRIRFILQEGIVQEYQRLISSHVGVLTLLLGMLNT